MKGRKISDSFQIAKLEKDFKNAEKAQMNCENLIQDLQARINSAENMRRHLEDENKVFIR